MVNELTNLFKAPAGNQGTQLEIFTARKHGRRLLSRHPAGSAVLPVASDTYEIRLFMFPRHLYFMKQNRNSLFRYTVFARCLSDGESVKLLNPVGSARLSNISKDFIELYFPILGRLIFIDLIPGNK